MNAAVDDSFDAGSVPAEAPGLFLGALASEINEPDELAPAFTVLMHVTENVLRSYRRGDLTEDVAAEYLRALRLTDEYGIYWRVGASSLRWYRRSEDSTWWFGFPPTEDHESHQVSLQLALAQIPEEFWQTQSSSTHGTEPTYGEGYGYEEDAEADVVEDPWGYSPGGERQTQSWGS